MASAAQYSGPRPVGRQRFSLTSLLPLLALFYATLLPPEVRINLLDQNLYAPRLVTILLLPWIIHKLAKDGLEVRLPDYLMFTGSLWMIISFVAFYDFSGGLVRGAALAFDVLAGYVIARLSIRNSTDFLRFLVLIMPGIISVGVIMMVESVSRTHIIRPIAAEIFGPLSLYRDGNEIGVASSFAVEIRLGVMRAGGPFSHPILAGLFMASMLPLYLYSGLRSWPLWLGAAAGFLAVFTGSSAAILSLMLGIALISYDFVQKRVDVLNWRNFVFAGACGAVLLQLLTQNGLVAFLLRFTLNPQTGAFRRLIWEYGTASVAKHPLIGIGYTEYERAVWMPPTVDNHWLMLGIRHGLFTPVCIALACVLVIFRLSTLSARQSELGRRFYVGFAICLFVFALMGFTVAFFGSVQYWFYILIGAGMSLCVPRTIDPAFRRQMPPQGQFAPAS